MTSPTSAGSVSVEVLADAKALAKSMRSEVEKAFKDLDVSKAIQDSVGKTPIKVPVEADTAPLQEKVRKTRVPKVKVPLDPDTGSIPEKVKKTRVPKVPVEIDPLLQAFQQEVRRLTATLARQVSLKVPVTADGGRLRSELGAQIAAVRAQSRLQVPTEPEGKAAYEAKLKAMLAEVSTRVRQNVKVDVDKRGLSGIGSSLNPLRLIPSLIGTAFKGMSDAMQESGNAAVRAAGNIAGALTTAAGPVGAVAAGFGFLAVGIGAMATAAAFAAPTLSVLAGAIAALPGLLAGAGAGFGTLALGFKGISDAFQPKAGGGGGGGGGEDPAARARRIAGAERGVEAARRGIAAATRGVQSAERGLAEAELRVVEAQRRAAQMQQAINRARVDAKENIEDLTRSLAGAKLSEEGAALGVTEALRALNAAKESGVLPDIQRADLEYRQAIQTLDEAKDSTEDLGIEQADAAKKGIEGSDLVQGALADQVEALKAVKDAQTGVIDAQSSLISANDGLKSSYDGLKSAQDGLAEANKKAASSGGGGGALAEVVKLAPAAQKFVDAIKALKPAFEGLRLDVQQRLFAGLDKTVTRLGEAWIPALRITLGNYADTFNGFFKNLGASITAPKFIGDIQIGAEASRKAFTAIGEAVSSKLVPAFGALSAAAAPFIETLGDEIAGIVTEFSDWILQGEKTDGLKDFFAQASESLHDLFTTGKLVGKIIGNLFRIITGGGDTGKTGIDSFNDGLTQLNTYLSDPKNQQSIRDFFGSITDAIADVGKYIKAFSDFVDKFRDVKKSLFGDDSGASSAGASIGKALVAGIATGVRTGFETTWGIIAAVLWGPDSLIGRIKSLLGIASPSTVMAEIGGWLIAGLAQGISDGVGDLLATVSSLPGIIRQGIGDATKMLVNAGRNVVVGLANGIAALYGSLRTRAAGLRTTIVNVFTSAGTFLANAGRNVVIGLVNGIGALYGTLRTRALGLRTTITNALLNAGTLLYNAGYNTVLGLWNGIASLGGWLYAKVANFVRNNIVNPVQAFLRIGSPSRLMFELGGYTAEGLALGMESEARRVEQAAAAIAAAALPQVADVGMDLTATGDAAIRSSLAVAGANSLQASWAPGMTGDKILDALKGSIKFSHRGDVQAALGSS